MSYFSRCILQLFKVFRMIREATECLPASHLESTTHEGVFGISCRSHRRSLMAYHQHRTKTFTITVFQLLSVCLRFSWGSVDLPLLRCQISAVILCAILCHTKIPERSTGINGLPST
ncbi:hypothetical protein BaRGS_00010610 [Batillaria attramentaria]|uniref:Uncharacterized protein n=1 Tax=Batillaria attramentaria TaxID=370345 RepID=A0ABD0LFC6_9CAEN